MLKQFDRIALRVAHFFCPTIRGSMQLVTIAELFRALSAWLLKFSKSQRLQNQPFQHSITNFISSSPVWCQQHIPNRVQIRIPDPETDVVQY